MPNSIISSGEPPIRGTISPAGFALRDSTGGCRLSRARWIAYYAVTKPRLATRPPSGTASAVVVSSLIATDWLHQLQAEARQPYPEELRRAIVAKNHPILRAMSSSYLQQIEIAVQREDFVSINHRTAALLASYFDILFALNRLPHPGEKRLLHYAEALCAQRPPLMRQQITRSSAMPPRPIWSIRSIAWWMAWMRCSSPKASIPPKYNPLSLRLSFLFASLR